MLERGHPATCACSLLGCCLTLAYHVRHHAGLLMKLPSYPKRTTHQHDISFTNHGTCITKYDNWCWQNLWEQFTHSNLLCEAFISFFCVVLALVLLGSQAFIVHGLMTFACPDDCPSDKCVMPAEQYVLILCADGTLSGCNINLRNLVTMWTVPGGYLPSLPTVCPGLDALP